jgi:FkbM family methyltransferase
MLENISKAMWMNSPVRRGIKRAMLNAGTAMFGDQNGRVMLPVVKGPAKGLWFYLDLKTRMETSYFLGKYDAAILQRLEHICRKGWTIWDCGTYLGFYTAFFARLVGPDGMIVAFEPDSRNLSRTRENCALNHLENVRFINAAIGPASAEVEFVLSDNTNSHLPGTWIGATPADYKRIERRDEVIRVRCMSLDDAFQDAQIPRPGLVNLVKLDIEGAEKHALPHAHELARNGRPLIVLELHNPDCDRAAWDFAHETGYSLFSLDTGQRLKNRDDVHGTLLCSPGISNPW